jgi:adenylate cyclase
MDPNQTPPAAPQSSVKVLIVEDDEFLRELYAETLKGEGYQVETAADGEEGLAKIKSDGWDIILLDIILPKMSGIDIMKQLKADPSFKIPKALVFLTNLDKDDAIKEALQYGDGYLIKSQITPGDMIREVKIYLDKKTTTTPTA